MALRPFRWRPPFSPACLPPIHVSSTSTVPDNRLRSGFTIALRNLWSSNHPVSNRVRPSYPWSWSAEMPGFSEVIR
jgi:hypothetical protein